MRRIRKTNERRDVHLRNRLSRVRRNGGKRQVYASGLEEKVIKDLEERGIRYEYEPEEIEYEKSIHRAHCKRCGRGDGCVQFRRYVPDLRINVEGQSFLVEIKGKFTAENRGRMEAVRKTHPDLDLRFLFQRDNWLTRKQKTRYSDWATAHGFQWAVGEKVPQEWLEVRQSSAQ